MSILSFEKPKKTLSTEKHNSIYKSDINIAGTYVPNMSREDQNRWKGKHITGDDERVEIRKTLEGVQLLIVVFKKSKWVDWNNGNCNRDAYRKNHQDIRISMNGKLELSWNDYEDMQDAIEEALEEML